MNPSDQTSRAHRRFRLAIQLTTRCLRGFGTLFLVGLFAGSMLGGSCYYHDDDDCRHRDDDDDFRCDDDDFGLTDPDPDPETPSAETSDDSSEDSPVADDQNGGSRFRLRQYQRSRFLSEDGGVDVLHLTDFLEISLLSVYGPGEYGEDDFRRFAEALIEANTDRIGTGSDSVCLEFQRVLFADPFIIVSFYQTKPGPSGEPEVVAGTALHFFFDRTSRLVKIEARIVD